MGDSSEERSDGDGNRGGGEKCYGGAVADPSGFYALPEDCISTIFSFTSPWDACVAAAVSRIFRSAAQSDILWERFLPPEYPSLVPESRSFSSKKELYISLSDEPLLVDGGKKSFWLEKSSGKKCYMLSARDISVIRGDTPRYWQWISVPESRFEEVAVLRAICWFEIRGKIKTRLLSPGTRYAAYIVFKIKNHRSTGFKSLEGRVGVLGSEVSQRLIRFDVRKHEDEDFRYSKFIRCFEMGSLPYGAKNLVEPKKREDGWMEVELGVFFNNGGVDGDEVEMSVLETRGGWKRGLIVEGIEIRPKEGVFSSKKERYLIDDGRKSFWLEESSGKKCYMLSARDITIIWGDTPMYCRWISLPDSRFGEVVELQEVHWLEIRGKINTRMLSPGTRYAAYIVFMIEHRGTGFASQPLEAGVGVVGGEVSRRLICFDAREHEDFRICFDAREHEDFRKDGFSYSGYTLPYEEKNMVELKRREDGLIVVELGKFLNNGVVDGDKIKMSGLEKKPIVEPKRREDGWMEVELGEFFNNGVIDGDEIEMSVLETKGGRWKGGLIVEGIEIRPKEGN